MKPTQKKLKPRDGEGRNNKREMREEEGKGKKYH